MSQLSPHRILQQFPLVKMYQALRRRRKLVDGLKLKKKILIKLFHENEEKLCYKAYNSPEWESISKQLHERCRRESVSSDKTAQQCKNKMGNLTKKYKTTKDKPLITGYEKGEMLRVTTKQKATVSLCLSIIRIVTKFSAIKKPSLHDTYWKVVRQSKPRVQCCRLWKEHKREMRRLWNEWQKLRVKAEENNKGFQWML